MDLIRALSMPQSEHPTTSNAAGQWLVIRLPGHQAKLRRDGYRSAWS